MDSNTTYDDEFMTDQEVVEEFGMSLDELEKALDQIQSGDTLEDSSIVETVDLSAEAESASPLTVTDEQLDDGETDDSSLASETTEEEEEVYTNDETASAHRVVQSKMDEFLDSKRMFGLINLSDRKEVAAIKDAINTLTTNLSKPLPKNEKDYAFGISSICLAYENLIERCKAYDTFLSKKWRVSSSDKPLKKLAGEIRSQCEKELAIFDMLKDKYIAGEMQKGNSWTDVLYSVRTERLFEQDLEKIGAGTSVLYIKPNGDGTKSYIKPLERMASSESASAILAMFGNTGDEESKIVEKVLKDPQLDKILANVNLMRTKIETYRGQGLDEATAINSAVAYSEDYTNNAFVNIENVGKFIIFYYKKYNEFYVGNSLAKISPGQTISDRNVSSSRLASRLGLEDSVAKSETVMITTESGSIIRANSMEGVNGDNVKEMAKLVNLASTNGKKITLSGNAARQLFELQIYDLIAGQVDRHMNNYMAFFREINGPDGGYVVDAIKAIDNDMAFGEVSGKRISGGAGRADGIINTIDINDISVPYISRKFYDRLMTPGLEEVLRFDQLDIRSQKEIDALLDRFTYIRDLVYKFVNEEPKKMYIIEDENEWEELYVQKLIELKHKNHLAHSYVSSMIESLGTRAKGNFLA